MNRIDAVKKVIEILNTTCESPAECIIRDGEALVEIGKALKGMSTNDAKATMKAVAEIEGVTLK